MLIDFVPTESGVSLAEAPVFLKAPGGAPAIVAIAVSRFGGQSAFGGKLGDNEFGHMLAGILRKNGVADQEFNFDTGARTALAFVTLKADGDREFVFYWNHSADMLLRPDELNLELIRSKREASRESKDGGKDETQMCSSYGFEFKSSPSTMIFLLFDSWFLCCHVSSALIPLSEFSEAAVMKKYGVQPDAKTLDIPNTAARQKSDDNGKRKQPCCEQRRMPCYRREGSPLSSVLILLGEPDNRCMS
uniref:Carbohydrate kinase PfkB domain-containing protein n=1 Tax=Brassica oleracea TaxID=3712 RepID=A0A3P6C5I0_BRAOL|nr:unnamed protein product [Brassica oleracea]